MFTHYMGDIKLKVKDEPHVKKNVHYIKIYIHETCSRKKRNSWKVVTSMSDIWLYWYFLRVVMYIYIYIYIHFMKLNEEYKSLKGHIGI